MDNGAASKKRSNDMSWYSDGEPFDEYEGCARCTHDDDPSRRTCEHCRSGDYWNFYDWDKYEQENEDD